MIVTTLIRTFIGAVDLQISGGYQERFLNLLNRNRISVWNLKKEQNNLYLSMARRDFKKIRPFVHKSGVTVHIIGKQGAPVLLHKYRRRKGIVIGILLALGLMAVLSCFVWDVEVVGNETLSSEQVLELFEEYGIKPGILRSQVDPGKLQRQAMLDLPEVSWISIYLDGTKAVIQVKERIAPPDIIPEDTPCNLIASKEGQIKRIEAYDGQAVVKLNQAVKQGDLLVSGIVTDSLGQNLLRHARGKVIALTQNTYEISVPLEQTKREYTGKVITRHYLGVFGTEIPLFLATSLRGQYEITQTEQPVTLFGYSLPMKLYTLTYQEYTEEQISYTEEEAKQEALRQLEEKKNQELSEVEIVKEQIDGQLENGEYRLHAKISCEENIAVQQEIFTKE